MAASITDDLLWLRQGADIEGADRIVAGGAVDARYRYLSIERRLVVIAVKLEEVERAAPTEAQRGVDVPAAQRQ